jgi:hypothetical protein
LIGPAVVAALAIWTARLRTDHVAIFQASASKAFKAAASIVLAAEALGVTVLAVAEALAASAVIALVAEVLAEDALADSVAVDFAAAVAGLGADGENRAWNSPLYFLETKSYNTSLKERT